MTEKTKLQEVLEKKLLAAMAAGKVGGFKPAKVQVSLRLEPHIIVMLDVLAEALGDTRTKMATDILEAAISDAAKGLQMPSINDSEFFIQYGDRLREVLGSEVERLTPEELEHFYMEGDI